MSKGLLERLPGGTIVAKDLSVDKDLVPGNPYCRYDTDSEERKYCSRELWEAAEDRFVIPEDKRIPRPLLECYQCENESYVADDGCCAHCGAPVFDCPGCGEEVHGKVDECPHCDAPYDWGDGDSD